MNANISIMIDIFKALSDENRLKIIKLLSGKKALCVCDIEKDLELPQNLVSHHLATLKQAKIVENCRCGKKQYYSLNNETLKELAKELNHMKGKE
jgi:ArsR family transcriptional regulator